MPLLVIGGEAMKVEVEFIDYYCTEPGWYWYRLDVEPTQTFGPYKTEDEAWLDAEEFSNGR